MTIFGILFPTLLGANHLLMSAWSPFYNAFNFAQKCEWLAWTNTVIFQTSFTGAYLWFGVPGYKLGTFFASYLACDTLFLTLYSRDWLMYFHHLLAGLVMYASYAFGYTDETAAAVIYLESSNILLGMSWLLNRAGYGKTAVMKVLGAVALLVYLLNRTILFPTHIFTRTPRGLMFGLLPFVPMNYYWSWRLVCYYAYVAFGMKVGH